MLTDRQTFSLNSMAGILEKFPLPRGSAAGELVASGIQQRCSLAEREVRTDEVFWVWTNVPTHIVTVTSYYLFYCW